MQSPTLPSFMLCSIHIHNIQYPQLPIKPFLHAIRIQYVIVMFVIHHFLQAVDLPVRTAYRTVKSI
jgi:hypothetical protein